MNLKEQITADMKQAMRAHEADKLSTIRMLMAAMKQKEVDERVTLDDTAIIAIIDKLIKQRKDSMTAYEKAQRQDMAEKESQEIKVLQAYLPKRMNEEETTEAIQKIMADLGASGPGDMGKIMGAVKQQLAGKADMGAVSGIVKKLLAS